MIRTIFIRYFSACCMLLVALSGCSSAPSYRAANGQGFGYSEVRLSPTDYRVIYQQRGFSAQKAKQGAIRRAAELAQADGQEWFVVVQESSDHNEPSSLTSSPMVERQCGLLTCQTVVSESPMLVNSADQRIVVTLTIRVGHGIRPSQAQVYSVEDVLQHVTP